MKRYFLFLLLCCVIPVVYAWTGVVVRVSDGDTVTVVTEKGQKEKLRFYGVDAPERLQSWGEDARERVSALMLNQRVEVRDQYRDPFGRMVAIVLLPDGRLVQEVLLQDGLAWVDRRYCRLAFCASWLTMLNDARDSRLGLWQDESPVPPWEWRKEKRQKQAAEKRKKKTKKKKKGNG